MIYPFQNGLSYSWVIDCGSVEAYVFVVSGHVVHCSGILKEIEAS